MNDESLIARYGLGAVVTTIDAVNGLNTLDSHQEAVKQVGIADLLLFTKTDLAAPSILVRSCASAIAAVPTPGSETFSRRPMGKSALRIFLAAGALSLWKARPSEVRIVWLNAEAYIAPLSPIRTPLITLHARRRPNRGKIARNRHRRSEFRAYCVSQGAARSRGPDFPPGSTW